MYIRYGKLDTKWRSRETKSWKEKSSTTVNGCDRYLNTRFPPVFKARLQLSLAENVFCQGMVVLLNPVCILLSEILYVYKTKVHVAVFKT